MSSAANICYHLSNASVDANSVDQGQTAPDEEDFCLIGAFRVNVTRLYSIIELLKLLWRYSVSQ